MDRKYLLKQLAAVLRVLIVLPSTTNLFVFLKRRYSSSQIRELNSVCKYRAQRIRLLERNSFLHNCLENWLVPHVVYSKVKKVRPRFAASIGRAFIRDEILSNQERIACLSSTIVNSQRKVDRFLKFFDRICFCKFLGETGCHSRLKIRSEFAEKLAWLRRKRFGSEELNNMSAFNLSRLELSRVQMEVLSRGPRFALPPGFVCREEMWSEFELFHQQVSSSFSEACSQEGKDRLRNDLTYLADKYASIRPDRAAFPLGKEHLKAIRELRQNDEIVITRPDKGPVRFCLIRRITLQK